MRRLLLHSGPKQMDAGILVLRLWFGLVLALAHGLGKISRLDEFSEAISSMGLPLPWLLAPAAVVAELIGGILLALGLGTRIAAIFVMVTMLVAAFVRHAADPFMKKELALAYAVVALVLLITGSGRFGIDGWLRGAR